MSIVGMIVMWMWFAAAFMVLSKWHMGGESDRRAAYWAKFEGR